jgi:hypothetical protein
LKRIELSTSSLPRKCSTPELQRLVKSRDLPYTSQSGRRGSNPRPTAWKAVALPTELLPLVKPASARAEAFRTLPASAQAEGTGHKTCGQGWIRTTELRRGQIYSLLPLATWLLARSPKNQKTGAREGIRTPDQLITNQLLYQLSYSGWYPRPQSPQLHSTLIYCFFWEGKGRLKCQIQKF